MNLLIKKLFKIKIHRICEIAFKKITNKKETYNTFEQGGKGTEGKTSTCYGGTTCNFTQQVDILTIKGIWLKY